MISFKLLIKVVARRGIEPLLPGGKPGVLADRRTGQKITVQIYIKEIKMQNIKCKINMTWQKTPDIQSFYLLQYIFLDFFYQKEYILLLLSCLV